MLTTRKRYIEQLKKHALMLAQSNPINADVLNAWADKGLERLEKQGRLVTDQQYSDHRSGRTLKTGDEVRYIGPERSETTNDGHSTVRPHGQEGTIVKTEARGNQTLVTFRPNPNAAETRIVDLVVLSGSRGYFHLERLIRQANAIT